VEKIKDKNGNTFYKLFTIYLSLRGSQRPRQSHSSEIASLKPILSLTNSGMELTDGHTSTGST